MICAGTQLLSSKAPITKSKINMAHPQKPPCLLLVPGQFFWGEPASFPGSYYYYVPPCAFIWGGTFSHSPDHPGRSHMVLRSSNISQACFQSDPVNLRLSLPLSRTHSIALLSLSLSLSPFFFPLPQLQKLNHPPLPLS